MHDLGTLRRRVLLWLRLEHRHFRRFQSHASCRRSVHASSTRSRFDQQLAVCELSVLCMNVSIERDERGHAAACAGGRRKWRPGNHPVHARTSRSACQIRAT